MYKLTEYSTLFEANGPILGSLLTVTSSILKDVHLVKHEYLLRMCVYLHDVMKLEAINLAESTLNELSIAKLHTAVGSL